MDFRYEVTSKSAEETRAAGQALAYLLKGESLSRVIALYGELGSGKTTFVGGFAKGLGITDRLLSPTFIIVRRYSNKKENFILYHIDLYRTEKHVEYEQLGLPEILSDTHAFIVLEWAQRLGTYLPRKRIDVSFEVRADGSHAISVEHVKT